MAAHRQAGYWAGALVGCAGLVVLTASMGSKYWLSTVLAALALAVLGWFTAGRSAPSPETRVAWRVRVGGYATCWVLLAGALGVLRLDALNWSGPDDGSDPYWLLLALIVFLVCGYALATWALTARRRGAVPATLVTGAGGGALAGLAVYLLAPFGGVLPGSDSTSPGASPARIVGLVAGPPLVLALLSARRHAGFPTGQRPVGTVGARLRQGLLAGILASLAMTLVASALTLATVALFPYRVAGPVANPQVLTAAARNVGNVAAPYLLALLAAPLFGLVAAGLGAVAGTVLGVLERRPSPAEPVGPEDGPVVLRVQGE